MAASRKYNQVGVLLPIERDVPENSRVLYDGIVPQNDQFMNQGFLFVRALHMGISNNGQLNIFGNIIRDQILFVVQSVSTGELFVNKLLEAPFDATTLLSRPPLELRVSTYRHAVGDSNIDILGNTDKASRRKGVLPDVPYFNKLRFWQELDPQDTITPNHNVYSLFFELCNGGTLRDLMDNYIKRGVAIPEHFIWLVAEQLFLALVAMNFGSHPHHGDDEDDGSESDDDSDHQPGNWARVYHRDLHAANVFIHYSPRGPGRIPRAGIEINAFPQIVVGDFGNSGIAGDDLAILPLCTYPVPLGDPDDAQAFLEEWEDIFSVGEILREMSMAHIPFNPGTDYARPNDKWVQDVNAKDTAPPYSAELITLLQRFEYPNMTNSPGVRELRGAVHTTFPSPEDLRDNLLPQAQARVLAFRNPANKPAGYYTNMDVSWTRPEELMPFRYSMEYAHEAGDGPDGGPPPAQDGSDSDSDHGGSGSGDDGDDDSNHDNDRSSSPAPVAHPDDSGGGDSGGGDSGGDNDSNHDNDGSSSPAPVTPPAPPPPPNSKQLAMRQLGRLHKWNAARPRYVLRSLEYRVPVIMPLKTPP